jgi:hypothetical protein
MLWHTLPSFRSEFWPSTRTRAIVYSKFTTNVSTSNLDPRSNLMSTPASYPNDFVKGMSIAISTAERIR